MRVSSTDLTSEIALVLKDIMITAGQVEISKVPVKAEVEIARDWCMNIFLLPKMTK